MGIISTSLVRAEPLATNQSEPLPATPLKPSLESPVSWKGILVGGGLIATAAAFDDHVQRRVQHGLNARTGHAIHQQDFSRPGRPLELLGRFETALGVSGAFYLGGAIIGSEKARRVGVTATEATLAGGLAALGVKTIVGRSRPIGDKGSDSFHFFHGDRNVRTSFPSGHTTTAFSVASVVADEYDSFWIDALAYGTASIVGFTRIYQSAHWLSDTVGGAVLGTMMGRSVSRWERRQGYLSGLYSDGRGIYVRRRF